MISVKGKLAVIQKALGPIWEQWQQSITPKKAHRYGCKGQTNADTRRSVYAD
jgi:hypothetical protein